MKKIIRIVGLVTVIVVIFVAIIAAVSARIVDGTNVEASGPREIWDEQTIVGNPEAKNHFIIYSDLVCPYCVAFENAIVENEEAFLRYIESNDILVEVRLSDFLYEYGEANPINSRYSAVATYCAKSEGKFWDYYNSAIAAVWNDYFKDLGKGAVKQMGGLGKDYWIKIGKQVGLSEEFENCVKEDKPLSEIKTIAAKTARMVDGMPYFKFNNYTSSGFDLSWGWEYVQMYFKAGLDS